LTLANVRYSHCCDAAFVAIKQGACILRVGQRTLRHPVLQSDLNRSGALITALRGFRGALFAASLISGVINLLALTGSFYMLQVYDRVLSSHSVPTLIALSVLAGLLFVFQGVLDVLRNQASGRAATLFERRVTPVVQALVVRQPLLGISISRAQQPIRDVDAIRNFLASGGPVAFLDLPWMPLYLAFVFVLHPLLGTVCLGGMMLLVMLTYLTERMSKAGASAAARFDATRRSIADANARNAEALKAMGFAGRAVKRFEQINHQFLALQTAASDVIANLTGISKVLRFTLQAGILGLGAYLTVHGEVTAGAIIAASIATSRALAPVEQAIAHWRGFIGARQSYSRLASALDAMPAAGKPLILPPPSQSLAVQNATIVVPGTQRTVLSSLSFELQRGQGLAIIGPSAAGKSSLARAITGIWPVARGSIRLDGAELDRWAAEDLGSHIGYVPQDVGLFEGTIADNICRLEDEKDSRAIISAAKAANIHEMILNMPDGYETNVGPDGRALSAGQRQRVALARALFRDPFLVVLDEPNSNLDADGEAALTSAINGVRNRGGIAIIIAHRPSALAAVDQVAMISGGQLTAFGPRDDVLKTILRQQVRAVPQSVT
jgi:PrtD family type I secretion system ABC transporter